MDILILGGTVFLGRHLVTAALVRGHRVSMFNRGQHNPELFPEVEKLRGDRDSDLAALDGRTWDAVIDTCGYVPRIVRKSAEKLKGSCGHYTFISSISVYSDLSRHGLTEDDLVFGLGDESVEEINGATYGPLKRDCELAVEAQFGEKALVVRPGLIVGPHDPTERFSYWPHRIAQGGKVLAPGKPEEPTQIIDTRDLAEWTLDLVEMGVGGTFNATGPDYTLTMGAVLECCKDVTGSNAELVWVSEQFLLEKEVVPWSEMPLWIPSERDETMRGFSRFDCSKAIRAGLKFRPLEETVRDTLKWDRTRDKNGTYSNCVTREKEASLLKDFIGRD
jgi:2'-hydroxyisoflavone reductase